VRATKFQRVRAAVAGRLFAAKPAFLPALSEIWGHVADLRGVAFCAANPSHVYGLPEYAEQQAAARERAAKPALEAAVERVQKARGQAGGEGADGQICSSCCSHCRRSAVRRH
jgi:hypothetical protein